MCFCKFFILKLNFGLLEFKVGFLGCSVYVGQSTRGAIGRSATNSFL